MYLLLNWMIRFHSPRFQLYLITRSILAASLFTVISHAHNIYIHVHAQQLTLHSGFTRIWRVMDSAERAGCVLCRALVHLLLRFSALASAYYQG